MNKRSLLICVLLCMILGNYHSVLAEETEGMVVLGTSVDDKNEELLQPAEQIGADIPQLKNIATISKTTKEYKFSFGGPVMLIFDHSYLSDPSANYTFVIYDSEQRELSLKYTVNTKITDDKSKIFYLKKGTYYLLANSNKNNVKLTVAFKNLDVKFNNSLAKAITLNDGDSYHYGNLCMDKVNATSPDVRTDEYFYKIEKKFIDGKCIKINLLKSGSASPLDVLRLRIYHNSYSSDQLIADVKLYEGNVKGYYLIRNAFHNETKFGTYYIVISKTSESASMQYGINYESIEIP